MAENDTIWTSPYIDTATSRSIITVARPIMRNGEAIGVVGLDFDMAELASLVRTEILISSLITVAVAIVIGLIIVFYFVRNINHNLNIVGKEMDQLASGVITAEDIEAKGDNEFKQLATSVNQMKQQTRQMLLDIKRATDQVASQSGTLSQASEQVREGSEQIAATMEELSSGSETQANSASDLAMTMERFNQYVVDATTDASDIDERSTHVLTLSDDGATKVHDSIRQMKNIEAIVKEAVDKVEGLESKATEIGSIVEVIQDISEQTNLLALNAAIEAARAGEEGRGFAVVADEVRKLAEQVGASVTDITSIIDAIQVESKSVATSLHKGYDAVEQGSNQMTDTGQAFDTIKQSITDMVENVSRIVSDLAKIKSETADMQKSVDDIAAVSEQSAAAVEETAASAEETSSSMEEVSRSADELRHLSKELEEDVNHFKL
jgi:methyl-accepting chemotaxis protein